MKLPSVRLLGIVLAMLVLAGVGYVVFVSYRAPIKDTAPRPEAAQVSGLQFEVVTSTVDQERGLGGRAAIPDNYAMLFVFQQPDRYGFWMKDMLAPIDIVWLSDKGDIILIDASVDPQTYPHVFYPPSPVRYVLETRANYAEAHAWTVGTHVSLPAPYGT